MGLAAHAGPDVPPVRRRGESDLRRGIKDDSHRQLEDGISAAGRQVLDPKLIQPKALARDAAETEDGGASNQKNQNAGDNPSHDDPFDFARRKLIWPGRAKLV
jgi:hypothetical protein